MTHEIIEITDDFWNIRGSFKVLGFLDLGTQCSLVRLASGGFALLDSYTLEGEVKDRVLARTEGGTKVEAILNLHPFHTIHVEAMAAMFPGAKLYGTARHHAKAPQLSWEPQRTEDQDCAELFADDFDFMVPRGVAFVPDDDKLHFASVLAFHRASHTLHVDDTLSWLPLPWGGRLSFHPTLAQVLEDRAGAAADFRSWAAQLAERCEDLRHLCTAHARLADVADDPPGGIAARVRDATARVEGKLRAHARNY